MTWLDDRVTAWHNSPTSPGALSEYLGMTPWLYKKFVEEPPRWVLGIDEVGYGSWAGPLVVGACLSPIEWSHPSLKDSKEVKGKNKEVKRAKILTELEAAPGARYFLISTSSEAVDARGVLKARIESFVSLCRALKDLEPHTLVVIDGDIHAPGIEHALLPKADTFVPQVMAAAMVAKVSRDTDMVMYSRQYPMYGFEKHKGYGSEEHTEALKKYGPCPIHRRSYRPIRNLSESSTSTPTRG